MSVYVTRVDTAFAATAGVKTVLKLITPTTFAIECKEIGIFTDGVTASAVPATWTYFTSDETTAGTGSGTAVTTQISGSTQAHGLTVSQKHSAEGTTYTTVKHGYIPQYMGTLILQFPLGDEPESPGGTADSFGITINVTANVNVLAYIKWARK